MKFECPSCHVDIHELLNKYTNLGFNFSFFFPPCTHSCPRCNVKLKCKAHPLHKLIVLLLCLSCLIFIAGFLEEKPIISITGAFLFFVTGYIFGFKASYKKWNYYHLQK